MGRVEEAGEGSRLASKLALLVLPAQSDVDHHGHSISPEVNGAAWRLNDGDGGLVSQING